MSDGISFYRYAAVVKNLRGVIYYRGGMEDRLRWLLSKFKYRSLGVTPSLADLMPKRKVLVELAYPVQAVEEAVRLFSEVIPLEAAEALCLASAYISPVMLIGELDEFKPAVIRTVKTSMNLDEKAWKLHMRIADYTTLDFYAWSTKNALEALTDDKRLVEALREREERAADDERRYWRLRSDEGRTFLAYLDPLRVVYEAGLRNEFFRMGEDAAAVLGLVAALII